LRFQFHFAPSQILYHPQTSVAYDAL
jgi:hypothetical protein